MSRQETEENFLQRWSRRKQQAEGAKEDNPSADTVPSETAQAMPGDEEMPPLESLDEHSDYSPFFSPQVSETLRRMALRKLFHGSLFNVTDQLDDYDEDFRDLAALGTLIPQEMRQRIGEGLEKLAETGTEAPVARAGDASAGPAEETTARDADSEAET
jgi:hypothetical protein